MDIVTELRTLCRLEPCLRAADEIERLRALLAEVCPPGLQKVSADLDARIRSALAAKGK